MGLDTSKKINRVTVNGIDMTVVGVPSLQDKTITENGSYTYDEPFDGLKTVEVDVQPDLITKTITENGTYKAVDDNADGYSEVVVEIAGGGGLDINGNLKQCEAGETLEAGDFVEITEMEVVLGLTTTRSQSSDSSYQYYKIAENKYLYFYKTTNNSGVGAMLIYKQDGKWATKNPLNTTNIYNYASYIRSCRLDSTKFLVCFGSGTYDYLYGAVVELVDDVLTVLKTTQISSTSRTVYTNMTEPQKLADNTFVVTTMGQSYPYIINFVINDDYSIEPTTSKTLSGKYMSDTIPLDNDNCLVIYNAVASGSGNVCELRKQTLSTNSYSSLTNIVSINSSNYIAPRMVKIDADNVAILYSKGFTSSNSYFVSPTQCKIYNITNNTLSAEVQISDKVLWTPPVLLEENKIQFVSVLGEASVQLNTVTFNNGEFVNNTTQTFGLKPYKFYNATSVQYPVSFLELEDGLFLNAYIRSVNTMCGLLYNIPKASKITSLTQTIAGVAKDSGNASDIVEVFVPNV